MSRLETGHRGASARDINDLCDLYQVNDKQRRRLLGLAREGKQRAWWQPLGLPYSDYVGLESEAVSISDFGLGFIPGLLQTADYARAIVHAAVPRSGAGDRSSSACKGGWPGSSSSSTGRTRPGSKRLSTNRCCTGWSAAAPSCELSSNGCWSCPSSPISRLRVIPYEAGALPAGHNKFIILKFASADVRDVVYIEGLTGDLYLEDPGDVETYSTAFRTLVELAKSPKETREIIAAMIPSYRGRPGRATAAPA